jgi:murein DD-endopeptidase MepM/ murein hydrolase activator NlpD
MRRFERQRAERLRRTAITIGLSFALGALADSALTWRLHELAPGGPVDMPASQPIVADPEPAHDTSEPRAVERPGEDGEAPRVATTGIVSHAEAIEMLRARDLDIPVAGIDAGDLRDTFFDTRGSARVHEAIDIMAPRHRPVRAVEDGTIARLFDSQGGGGVTIYQIDPTGTYCYYYAHLDRHAGGLREGQTVRRGQTIGYVGSTGNAAADAPHLHFSIFLMKQGGRCQQGEAVNPYPVLNGGP